MHVILYSCYSGTDVLSGQIIEISLRWLKQDMIYFQYFLAYGMASAKKIPDNQISIVLPHRYSLGLGT